MFSRGKLLCSLIDDKEQENITTASDAEKDSIKNTDQFSSNSHDVDYVLLAKSKEIMDMEDSGLQNQSMNHSAEPDLPKDCTLFLSQVDAQISNTAMLTDISNNIVTPSSFHNRDNSIMDYGHDFSPSDEEYIPNTDENDTDYEYNQNRHVFIPESSNSSCDSVEIEAGNNFIQPLNTHLDLPPPSSTKHRNRKRTLNATSWKCNVRKLKTITGQEYISKKGKIVPEKKMKSVCACRLKCGDRINEASRLSIFQKYYGKEMTWDLKRQFILTCVSEVQTARTKRQDLGKPPKRSFTLYYSFLVKGLREKVCKKFFLNTLAISETVVRNSVKKSTDGFVQEDRRGRHQPSNKISEDIKYAIRRHIEEIPKYESHYSRNRTKRSYLGSHLNIDKLYSLYVEKCTQEGVPKENIAKAWLYRHIFNTEYNLGFNPPANDTCDDCDAFVIKFKNSADATEKAIIKADHDKHLEEAKLRYNMKGFDKVNAMESHGTKRMLTVDLQKCLPTPLLTNSQSFYLRKLWTFNFTLMDSVLKESWCFMWDETVAGRGGNEMASGIVKFFEQLDDSVTEVTIWSDNCAGQNKNVSIIMLYLLILSQKPTLQIINHKYLLKGHTHMEVDVIHSVIEREKKKHFEFAIVTPWDWQQFIKNCSKGTKMKVINMESSDFKDFAAFCRSSAPFVHRKKSTEGNSVPYSSIVWMQFRKNEKVSMFYKTSFQQETFEEVNLIRNRRRDFVMPTPEPVRTTPKPISKMKYADLQKSLQWIPSMFHGYYKNLPCADVPDLPEPSGCDDN